MPKVTRAAGATIRTLTRNLSRRSHSWVRVAAIVVSEMNERLSPKKAPPTTMAVSQASFMPVSPARPAATGTSATTVPTEVPIENETKHEARNSPAGRRLPGSRWSVSATVASTAPMLRADSAKAPASTKIQIISMMFGSEAPREKWPMRSAKGVRRITATA